MKKLRSGRGMAMQGSIAINLPKYIDKMVLSEKILFSACLLKPSGNMPFVPEQSRHIFGETTEVMANHSDWITEVHRTNYLIMWGQLAKQTLGVFLTYV